MRLLTVLKLHFQFLPADGPMVSRELLLTDFSGFSLWLCSARLFLLSLFWPVRFSWHSLVGLLCSVSAGIWTTDNTKSGTQILEWKPHRLPAAFVCGEVERRVSSPKLDSDPSHQGTRALAKAPELVAAQQDQAQLEEQRQERVTKARAAAGECSKPVRSNFQLPVNPR